MGYDGVRCSGVFNLVHYCLVSSWLYERCVTVLLHRPETVVKGQNTFESSRECRLIMEVGRFVHADDAMEDCNAVQLFRKTWKAEKDVLTAAQKDTPPIYLHLLLLKDRKEIISGFERNLEISC